MPRRDLTGDVPRVLTPAGGMVLSVAVSGVLWSGMVVAVHLVGGL